MVQHKCTFGDQNTEITVKPDGRNELDPCLYQEIGTYDRHLSFLKRRDNMETFFLIAKILGAVLALLAVVIMYACCIISGRTGGQQDGEH